LQKSFIDTTVNVRDLEVFALDKFIRCPKYTTIVRHGDLEDNSEFFCTKVFVGPPAPGTDPYHRYFAVPRQSVVMAEDILYGLFSITYVMDDAGEYWLVTSEKSGLGFLLDRSSFTFDVAAEKKEEAVAI
jgi:hypothetical protein